MVQTRPATDWSEIEHAVLCRLTDASGGARLRRAIDVALALALVVALSPLLALIATAIVLEDGRAVLFAQPRCGWNGGIFTCYKFRTMRPHAGSRDPRQAVREDGSLIKPPKDPRVTRVGALLRRWSMDELPQLYNVLRGDMTLVGPRPLIEPMLAPYPEFRRVRSLVPPGITGLWQVSARERNERAIDMLEHDVAYLLQRSAALDAWILARTVSVVLRGRGAR